MPRLLLSVRPVRQVPDLLAAAPTRFATDFEGALALARNPPRRPLRSRLAKAARDVRAGLRYGYHWCCIARYVWDTFHGAQPALELYLRRQEFYESGPLGPSDIWPEWVPCRRHERLGLARVMEDVRRGRYCRPGCPCHPAAPAALRAPGRNHDR